VRAKRLDWTYNRCLLNYVRKKNVATLIKELRKEMDKKRPLKQTGACANHDLKWSFSSLHNHSSGEEVKVSHITVNVFSDQQVSSAEKAAI
jgi:hypothetical protein